MSETPLEERIGRALHSASGANTDWNEEWVRDSWSRQVAAALSVLHEAGTQEDEGAVNAEEWAKADAGKAYLDHVIATVKKHGRHSDTGCPPGFRAMCSEAMALRAAIEAAPAVSGTPDGDA